MSFLNNDSKVRIFGEFTKFLSDFFTENRTFFRVSKLKSKILSLRASENGKEFARNTD